MRKTFNLSRSILAFHTLVGLSFAAPTLNHDDVGQAGPSIHSTPARDQMSKYAASRASGVKRIDKPQWDKYSFHPIKDGSAKAQEYRGRLDKLLKDGIIAKAIHKKQTNKSKLKENAVNYVKSGGVVHDKDSDNLIHLDHLTRNDIVAQHEAGLFRHFYSEDGIFAKDEFEPSVAQKKYRKIMLKEQKDTIHERRNRRRRRDRGMQAGTGEWTQPDEIDVPEDDLQHLDLPHSPSQRVAFPPADWRSYSPSQSPISSSPSASPRNSHSLPRHHILPGHSAPSSPPSSPPRSTHATLDELEMKLHRLNLDQQRDGKIKERKELRTRSSSPKIARSQNNRQRPALSRSASSP